ncbi:hypothetical protein NUM3379_01550 [Kineococcus sp. NUM-3379]
MPPTAPREPLPRRPRTFLIAQDSSVSPASSGPLDFGWLIEQVEATPGVKVEQRLHPRSLRGASLGTSVTDEVVVASLPEEVATEIARHPQVLVEEDSLVLPHQAPADAPAAGPDPGLLSPFGTSTSWTIGLVGPGGEPVPGATVYLYGSGIPAQGRTDDQGVVTLALLNESDATLRALYVNPLSGYWSLWQDRPVLTSGTRNVVALQPLSETFGGFPGQEVLGWGQVAMRMDRLPAGMTGRGVQVAVVDSGAAAATHPDLAAVVDGVDLTTTPSNTTQWREDTIAHGSHCSGVIAGARGNGGIRGFAPEVRLHQARIFPGGRISSLLDAVDYCIDHGIDVVNMSLGTGGSSQILLQKLAQAKELGVACIVAAGNTGGGVQFPGTSPDVLTVSAIGKEGTFPAGSYHAKQVWSAGASDQGYFSAQFSCHGPEVDVCGPGVAVLSSVPPAGYAAWDGTSMATPHVAGLAALVLAHHPDFQEAGMNLKGAARVDHLFALLRSSVTPLDVGDPERVGAGLPDAPRALGLEPGASAPPVAETRTTAIRTALAQLSQVMAAAGLHPGRVGPAGAPVDVAGAPAPAIPSQRVSTERALAELCVRMAHAGLDCTPASTPPPRTRPRAGRGRGGAR